jgi:hypothetical protein
MKNFGVPCWIVWYQATLVDHAYMDGETPWFPNTGTAPQSFYFVVVGLTLNV